jgi:hypothetical protein
MKRLFPFLFLSNTPVPGDDARFFPKFFLNIFADFRPEDVPMRPEAAELFKQRAAALSRDTPTARCLPQGVPWGDLLPVPRRFIHQPNLLVVLYEGRNPPRLIYLDGRPHPEDPQPAWLGYAVGRWEGDTLLVETRGFNDKAWLDAIGHPRSEQMRLTERFRRPSLGRIEVEATIDDSGAYTKPFSIRYTQTLTPDTDLLEMICTENERDSSGTVGQR